MSKQDHHAHALPIGLLRPDVYNELCREHGTSAFTIIKTNNDGTGGICFADDVLEQRQDRIEEVMLQVLMKWKEKGLFPDRFDGKSLTRDARSGGLTYRHT
jgi:hypothetical protein